MIKSSVSKSLTALTCATALCLGGAPAMAGEDLRPQAQPQVEDSADTVNPLSSADKAEMQASFEEYGLSADTQERLLAKWEAGQPWDSFLPDSEPVSTSTETADGVERQVDTYADGSLAIRETSIPEGQPGFSPDNDASGISECQYTGSAYAAYWKNCKGNVNLLAISMGFYFDREYVRGGSAKITRAWGHHHHCVGCSLSSHRLEKFSDADYRYSADLDVVWKGFPVGWTAYMGVQVQASDAWTYNN